MLQSYTSLELEGLLERTQGLCELLDDEGACSVDGTCLSNDGFAQALRARGAWLLGLLALQSCSSFVLVRPASVALRAFQSYRRRPYTPSPPCHC